MQKPPEILIETDEVRVRIMTLQPGGETAFHYHSEVTDYFVCLTGIVAINLKQPVSKIVLAPGERFTVGAGLHHQVSNQSVTDEARYLLIQWGGRYDFIT